MKLDRQEVQYRPTIHQNRGKDHAQRQNNYEYRNSSYSQDRKIPTSEVEETFNTITEVIGPTIEIEVDQEITGMEIAIEGATIP